jgi:hypothetical protein
LEDILLDLFTQHPQLFTWLGVILAAHALALVVVAMTPTPRDDQWVKNIYRVVEWVAGIVGRAKDKGNGS